ncbi:MAG: DUF1592 domain-containing protein [Planctomycetia bacterium]|nr:DUF1592 domain-containing protein [Planctomycetia bacterium]
MQRLRLCFALIVGGLLAVEARGVEPASPDAEGFQKQILPLLANYCGDCHGDEAAEAELSLTKWESPQSAMADREKWIQILKMVRAGVMPPPDYEPVSPDDLMLLSDWVDRAVLMIDCGQERSDPGRVTIRRLNRAEYNNTIRDLTGIALRPADDFPADDVGYGFDNIGDVLSLPPVLFEKYLAAAEKVVDQAIVMPGPGPEDERVAANKLRSRPTREVDERGFVKLHSQDDRVTAPDRIEQKGQYIVRVRAYADQAGDETAKLSVRLDRDEVQTISVAHTVDAPGEYEVQFKAEDTGRITLAFVNDFVGQGDDGIERDRNVYVEWLEYYGPLPTDEKLPESHRRIVIKQPGEKDRREVAREILAHFAKRAFRRPVTDEEVDGLLPLYDLAADHPAPFERGLQLALSAVLSSPSFLFRIENDPTEAVAGEAYPISECELATRLSYFLWSSMPDEELFALADRGELRANLDSQIARMLADPKSQALVENFGGQWLQTRRLDSFSPDPARFPEFDEALRKAMRQETESFFTAIVREDRSVLEFIDANYTFLNERLAKLYGIEGVTGDEFRRVELGDSPRGGGVLTQASVLAITSNPTRTSPVKRGKWIMEQLLGTPPPPAPPNVPELDGAEGMKLVGSLRERMVQHRENPLCASCHQQMDTLGFGMENFNAIGQWREQDGEFAIDAAGTLPDGRSFATPRELKRVLLEDRQGIGRCLAEKMLTYALGRGVEYDDKCAVDEIVTALDQNDYRFSVLVRAIVASDPFQYRRAQGAEQ